MFKAKARCSSAPEAPDSSQMREEFAAVHVLENHVEVRVVLRTSNEKRMSLVRVNTSFLVTDYFHLRHEEGIKILALQADACLDYKATPYINLTSSREVTKFANSQFSVSHFNIVKVNFEGCVRDDSSFTQM